MDGGDKVSNWLSLFWTTIELLYLGMYKYHVTVYDLIDSSERILGLAFHCPGVEDMRNPSPPARDTTM